MGLTSTDEDEPTEAIGIGMIIGGTRDVDDRWVDAVRALRSDIDKRQSTLSSDINLALEIHVPGNLRIPEFEGVRTGAYRKRDNLLKVQVALPWTAPDDPRAELLSLFGLGLDAVDAWAVKRKREIDTGPLRQLLAEVAAKDDG